MHRGSALHRSALRRPEYFWSRPLGRQRPPYNGGASSRLEPRSVEPGAQGRGQGARRGARARPIPGNDAAGSRRPRHALRQRARSAHLARPRRSTRSRRVARDARPAAKTRVRTLVDEHTEHARTSGCWASHASTCSRSEPRSRRARSDVGSSRRMTDERPDPDELLRRVVEEERESKRGKLTIFFGAAPGRRERPTRCSRWRAPEIGAREARRRRRHRRDARALRNRGARARARAACRDAR